MSLFPAPETGAVSHGDDGVPTLPDGVALATTVRAPHLPLVVVALPLLELTPLVLTTWALLLPASRSEGWPLPRSSATSLVTIGLGEDQQLVEVVSGHALDVRLVVVAIEGALTAIMAMSEPGAILGRDDVDGVDLW